MSEVLPQYIIGAPLIVIAIWFYSSLYRRLNEQNRDMDVRQKAVYDEMERRIKRLNDAMEEDRAAHRGEMADVRKDAEEAEARSKRISEGAEKRTRIAREEAEEYRDIFRATAKKNDELMTEIKEVRGVNDDLVLMNDHLVAQMEDQKKREAVLALQVNELKALNAAMLAQVAIDHAVVIEGAQL